jgi:ATP-binding cassette subfamily F protein uup
VLDEPTNDLDIETLELLETLLQDYAGTVLLVSHDRAFLDNVVTQVIAWDGDGRWLENLGGYAEWARIIAARREAATPVHPADPERKAAPARTVRATRLSWKEQQELKQLPARIEALEREQAELTRRMSDAEFYRAAAGEIAQVQARYGQLEDELMAALERWDELEKKAQAAAQA